MKTKKCYRCQTTKPISDFGKNKQKPDGIAVYCKKCFNKSNRESTLKKPKILTVKNKVRKKPFGLSDEKYNEMLLSQKQSCAICKKSFVGIRIYIDHCHELGHVRGLLCLQCNVSLGHVKDNVEVLKSMINYLSL